MKKQTLNEVVKATNPISKKIAIYENRKYNKYESTNLELSEMIEGIFSNGMKSHNSLY